MIFQPDIEPGDVIIVLQQKTHELFQRSRDDLIMTRTISLTEALCGFAFVIRHLDGRDLVMRHPVGSPIIKPGDIRAIVNEGMPHYRSPFEHGQLYVKFDVQFPENHFANEAQLKVSF